MRITALLLALTLAACGPVAPAEPPTAIQHSEADALLVRSKDLSGKRITIEGYINFDGGPQGGVAMRPELRTAPAGGGSSLFPFDIKYGEGPSQLHLAKISEEAPPQFPNAPKTITFDLRKTTWQDSAGAAHPFAERVRLTGEVWYPVPDTDGRYRPFVRNVKLEPVG